MSAVPYINSKLYSLPNSNMLRTDTACLFMDKKFNMPQPTHYHQPISLTPPKKIIQQIISTFLYYGLALDLTMLVVLGTLATQQANPTTNTWDDIVFFLNYCTTNPDDTICFSASNMVMYIASDGSYLSESKARSRVEDFFTSATNLTTQNIFPPPNTRLILLSML